METLIIFGAKYLFAAILQGAAAPLISLTASDRKEYVKAGILTLIAVIALKTAAASLYYDPRPFTQGAHALIDHAANNGFPSDHALFSFTLAFLSLSVSMRIGLTLIPTAAIVGTCRVLAGVHHPVDIVAGAVLGAAAVAAGTGVSRLVPPRKAATQE